MHDVLARFYSHIGDVIMFGMQFHFECDKGDYILRCRRTIRSLHGKCTTFVLFAL